MSNINLLHFKVAINVMTRVHEKFADRFDLETWNNSRTFTRIVANELDIDSWAELKDDGKFTEETLNKLCIASQKFNEETFLNECGTVACFSGWMALSKEARLCGATMAEDGSMQYKGYDDDKAMSEFLGVSQRVAEGLVYGDSEYYPAACRNEERPVTALDVVKALRKILKKHGYVERDGEIVLKEKKHG